MNAPAGRWIELDEVDSTQRVAAEALAAGEDVGYVFAHHQRAGKGRFGRHWHSGRGDSLTFSIVFSNYADHPHPYLIGMTCALACARALTIQVRWPNDLVFGERKVGGILTELLPDPDGRRVPVVGIGINLKQTSFPIEIQDTATSLLLAHGTRLEAETVARAIVQELERLPEPDAWSGLAPIWSALDRTPGKQYRLPDGTTATAVEVGPDARLLCTADGKEHTVMAAEALFGS